MLCEGILFIYFWLCWVFVAACGLSLVVASRGYSLVVVSRLLIEGFSCFGVWALGLAGFSICGYHPLELWHRLSCSMACRILPIRDQTCVSCIGRQSLYHCTSREVRESIFESTTIVSSSREHLNTRKPVEVNLWG